MDLIRVTSCGEYDQFIIKVTSCGVENLIRVTQYGANFNKGDVIWGQLSEKYCYSIAIALYYL